MEVGTYSGTVTAPKAVTDTQERWYVKCQKISACSQVEVMMLVAVYMSLIWVRELGIIEVELLVKTLKIFLEAMEAIISRRRFHN